MASHFSTDSQSVSEDTSQTKTNMDPTTDEQDGTAAASIAASVPMMDEVPDPAEAGDPAQDAEEAAIEVGQVMSNQDPEPAVMPQAADSIDPKPRRGRGLLIALLVLIGLVGIAYGAGLFYFSSHFVPNTMVGGIDASWLTVDDLAAKAQESAGGYVDTVEGNELSLTLSASDIGLSVDGDAFAADAFAEQDPVSWPITAIRGASVEPEMKATVDRELCQAKVSELVAAFNESATWPEDAHLNYNAEAGAYEIVPEKLGSRVNPDAIAELVAADAELLRAKTKIGEAELARPRYLQDYPPLKEALDKANAILNTKLQLMNGGEKILDVDKGLVSQWIEVLNEDAIVGIDEAVAADAAEREARPEEGEPGVDGYYYYDEEADDYLWAWYADEVDPWDRPDWDLGAVFAAEGGPRIAIRLNRGAIRNWAIETLGERVNGEDEVRTWELDAWETSGAIKDALNEGRSGELQVVTYIVEERPPETEGHEARGRHIDVNLSTQYARMYADDGKTVLWRTYIVSGQAGRYDTPPGEYEIESRALDIIMVGADEDGDGEPDYRTPCTFWMGFYGGFGIHDSWWRNYYGEDIYTWYGSHGCVNVSYEKAEELWNLTDYGDKVYVHY